MGGLSCQAAPPAGSTPLLLVPARAYGWQAPGDAVAGPGQLGWGRQRHGCGAPRPARLPRPPRGAAALLLLLPWPTTCTPGLPTAFPHAAGGSWEPVGRQACTLAAAVPMGVRRARRPPPLRRRRRWACTGSHNALPPLLPPLPAPPCLQASPPPPPCLLVIHQPPLQVGTCTPTPPHMLGCTTMHKGALQGGQGGLNPAAPLNACQLATQLHAPSTSACMGCVGPARAPPLAGATPTSLHKQSHNS